MRRTCSETLWSMRTRRVISTRCELPRSARVSSSVMIDLSDGSTAVARGIFETFKNALAGGRPGGWFFEEKWWT